MKFGLELEGSLFPLWKSYYVDYDGLKNLLDELKDNFPYMRLFKMHELHIDNDPSEPFKFLISGVTFQFKDHDSGSSATHTGTLKILSVREREDSDALPQATSTQDLSKMDQTMMSKDGTATTANNDDPAFGNMTGESQFTSNDGTKVSLAQTPRKEKQAHAPASPTGSDIVDEVALGATFVFDLCSSVATNPRLQAALEAAASNGAYSEGSQPLVGSAGAAVGAVERQSTPKESDGKTWLGTVLDIVGATNANASANANAFTAVHLPDSANASAGSFEDAAAPTQRSQNEPFALDDKTIWQSASSPGFGSPQSYGPPLNLNDTLSQTRSQQQQGNFLNETFVGNGGGVAYCELVPPSRHIELFHLDPSNATLLKRSVTTVSTAEQKSGKKATEGEENNKGKKKKKKDKKADDLGNPLGLDEKEAVTFDNFSLQKKTPNVANSQASIVFNSDQQASPRFASTFRFPSPQANLDALAGSIRFKGGDLGKLLRGPNTTSFAADSPQSMGAFNLGPTSGIAINTSSLSADFFMLNFVSKMLDVYTVGYADPQFSAHLYGEVETADLFGKYLHLHPNNDNEHAEGAEAIDSEDPHVIALRQMQKLQHMTLHTRSVLGIANAAERRKAPKSIAPHGNHHQHKTHQAEGQVSSNEGTLRRRGSVVGKQSLFPHHSSQTPRLSGEGNNKKSPLGSARHGGDDTNAYTAPAEGSGRKKSLVSHDNKMKQLQRLQQLQDLYSMRLTMHFYINRKYFSADPNRQLSPSASDGNNSTSSKKHSISYCNPAIAHALYAYQRSVSATIAAALQIEIEKASNFYLSQTHVLCRSALLCIDSVKMWEKLTTKDRAQLRTVYRQTYLTFRILQQFCDLNIIAIGKFLKKADKNLLQNSLENYRVAVEQLNFRMGHNSRITALQKLMAEMLAVHAMNGSIKKAFNFLETTRDDGADFSTAHFGGDRSVAGARFGKSKSGTLISLAFMWGAFLSVVAMIIVLLAASGARGYSIMHSDQFATKNAEYLILIPFVIALPQFLFSINVMIYEQFGINYAFMFELDPIFHWSGAELMRDSLIYFFAWAVCVYVFLRNGYNELNCSQGVDHVAPHDGTPSVAPLWAIFPFFLVIWLSIAAYNKFISVEQRQFWSAHVFWHIVTTPYYPVKFADFFLCNYLTSMTTTLFEFQWYWCTFTTDSVFECTAGRSMSICILNSLPNIWRMVQSTKRFLAQPKATRKPFPNLINAGKYATGVLQPFVWTGWAIARYKGANQDVLTTMYVLSFAAQLLTQTYKFTWDIVVDAGIFIDYGNNGYEWRKERVYKAWWPYLLFIAVDFTFRWRWIMTYYIQLDFKPPWFFAVWAIMELIRRTFWSTFRVENEHVNNTEHYRATKLAPIPVKNIHAWDTFAPDSSPEQFLAKSRKNQFSKEFPSIKGVNLSSVTRFFAALPEKEKLAILVNSPLCAGYVPSVDDEGHFTAKDSNEEAAAVNLNETLGASRIGLHTRYISPAAVDVDEEKPKDSQPQGKSKLSNFVGSVGEGKTKFFSELPEEYKIIVIVSHLKSETMNAFERRIKAEVLLEKDKEAVGGNVQVDPVEKDSEMQVFAAKPIAAPKFQSPKQ